MDDWARTFDRDPDGYATGRPGYPDDVFGVLETRCGLGPGVDVLEIGPGTGQATKQLLARGARVHAVEPGRRLAAYLRRTLGDQALTISVSTFEHFAVERESADLAVSATAFHWIDAEQGMPRVAAALRPGGWVALWWNVFHDPKGPDALSRALEPVFAAVGDKESPHGGARALDEGLWLDHFAQAGLEAARAERFVWEIEHTTDDVVALFETFSGTRARPPVQRRQLLDGIRSVADERFGGRIRRSYVTPLYTARKPSATPSTALTMPS